MFVCSWTTIRNGFKCMKNRLKIKKISKSSSCCFRFLQKSCSFFVRTCTKILLNITILIMNKLIQNFKYSLATLWCIAIRSSVDVSFSSNRISKIAIFSFMALSVQTKSTASSTSLFSNRWASASRESLTKLSTQSTKN